MQKFKKLSKSEMRNVKGGFEGGGCPASECSGDADCANSKYGTTCYKTTCASTGKPYNYCVSGS